MSNFLPRLLRQRGGNTAAEFALVLPLLLLLLFGIIEAGRLMWYWNRAEKATQMAVRYATVTKPIASGMVGYSFVGVDGLTQGDIIPRTAYGTMTCTVASGGSSPTCSCDDNCPWGTAADSTAFSDLLAYVQNYMPELSAQNIVVEYSPSGLGYAGNPGADGMDISPMVTIGLQNVPYQPMLLRMFGVQSFNLPGDLFRASMTMEDGSGKVSN